jgi:hypothetical protein
MTLFPTLDARAQWEIQTLDSPKYFEYFGPRSIAVDNQGRPHMAYGGDRLYHAYFDDTGWHEETVDSSPGAGWAASIAIDSDSDNAVHICYTNASQYRMMYATKASSGSWTTVELAVGSSMTSTIAVDAQNHVHMCWVYYSELQYATNASGSFQVVTLKSGSLASPSSLTTDSQGKIHICYAQFLNPNWTLQHLTNATLTGEWSSETVDPGAGANFGGCVVAVDSLDKVHIGYVYDSWSLRHATNETGTWVREEVLTGADSQISMDLDSSNHVHLSYRTSIQGISGLRRATNATPTGSWTNELVAGGSGPFAALGITGFYSSIVVDGQNHLHISYFDNWLEGLQYATNASGAWVSTTVDTAGAPGQYCSIAVDPSDRVHISYNDSIWNFGKLKYAVSDTVGGWSLQEVDNSGRVGQYSSIAADSAGHAHIAYGDNAHGTTKYATNEAQSWAQATVSSSQGQYISLALDSSGNAHMAYIDYVESGSRVAYANNTLGTWTTEAVETSASYGLYYTSIAVDSQDQVHLVYYDYTAKTLKHAAKTSTGWDIESIASGVNLTSPTSVAVDASDKLHVCYYIYSSDPPGVFDLVMHATNALGSWTSEEVGFSGTVSAHGSIAVDHSENIHISFNTGGNGTGLTYASNATGKWVLENVDASLSEVGGYHSLAVDSQNRVHIAYYDATLRDLKYARKTSGAIAHTLTINKSGSGTGGVTSTDGQIDCGPGCASDTADYLPGDEVRLTASAAPGSSFRGWNGGGCSGYGECVVTMTADTSVTATFAELFTLFVNKGGNGAGRVVSGDGMMDCGSGCPSASADYFLGDQVRLTATADPGSAFTGWTGGGCSGTGECVLNIGGDTNVTASFSVPNLPDLTGSFSNITRRTTRFFGRTRHVIGGRLNVFNVGAADCNQSFGVRVYQSLDGIYSADDKFLGYLSFSSVHRGRATSRTFSYRIVNQNNVSGTFLIAVMDATNRVAEGNEANNIVLRVIP